MKRLFVVIMVLLVSMSAVAKKKEEMGKSSMKFNKPFSSLDTALGHTLWSVESSKWVSSNNEVKDLDVFDSWEFGTSNLLPQGEKFLYLKKKFTQKKYGKKKVRNEHIYLLDIDEYKMQIDSLNDGENIIFLSVLDKSNFKSFEPVQLASDNYYTKIREEIKQFEIEDASLLEQRALKQANYGEADRMAWRIKYADNPFYCWNKLAIKFRVDENRENVQFIFFETEWDHVLSTSFTPEHSEMSYLEVLPQTKDIVLSSLLWESFYYETDYDSFMKFIKSPLKNLR